jgi:hypothetical protein
VQLERCGSRDSQDAVLEGSAVGVQSKIVQRSTAQCRVQRLGGSRCPGRRKQIAGRAGIASRVNCEPRRIGEIVSLCGRRGWQSNLKRPRGYCREEERARGEERREESGMNNRLRCSVEQKVGEGFASECHFTSTGT